MKLVTTDNHDSYGSIGSQHSSTMERGKFFSRLFPTQNYMKMSDNDQETLPMSQVPWVSRVTKLVSAIPTGLKCETRNNYYRLLHRHIYSSFSKQSAILLRAYHK
jgi:hypothetical protein